MVHKTRIGIHQGSLYDLAVCKVYHELYLMPRDVFMETEDSNTRSSPSNIHYSQYIERLVYISVYMSLPLRNTACATILHTLGWCFRLIA